MARGSCQPTDEPHGHVAMSTHCAEAAANDLENQSPLPQMGEGLLPSHLREMELRAHHCWEYLASLVCPTLPEGRTGVSGPACNGLVRELTAPERLPENLNIVIRTTLSDSPQNVMHTRACRETLWLQGSEGRPPPPPTPV